MTVEIKSKRLQRPDIDRGWAWVVLIATYLGMVVYCNTLYMGGVFYIALLDRYNEGEAKTSLVGAVSSGLLCFSAPLGGVINNRFSCRCSIVIGGIFTTAGFVLSAFVPSLDWMIVTSGALVGLGYGISSAGLICVVGFYFEKWRDVALSTAFLTVGVAMFLSAPLGLFLIGRYGLTSAFLILACIQAQMCVFGVISKPSVIEDEVHAQKIAERESKETSNSKTYLDLSLLKNVPYMGFLCSTTTWNFALTVAIMHLPNYVRVLAGSDSDIGYLMASFSVANIVGRLAGSLTVSKLHGRSIYVHVLVLLITGLLSSAFPLYSKLGGGVYVFTIQLGIFTGWPNAMMTPISLSFVGVAKLSEAYGLAYVFCGIGVSTGPVLIGYLYSLYGSYEYSFVVAGGLLLLGSLFGGVALCTKQQRPNEMLIETIVSVEENPSDIKILGDKNGHAAESETMKPLINGNSKPEDLEIKMEIRLFDDIKSRLPETNVPLLHSINC